MTVVGAGPYSFRSCWFEDNALYGAYVAGSHLNVSFDSCQFPGDSTSTAGIGISSSASPSYLTVIGCHFQAHTSGYSIINFLPEPGSSTTWVAPPRTPARS